MFYVAEIGWNFIGDLNLAKEMISAAAKSGATHVKFQLWSETNLSKGAWDNDGRREIYKKAQLTDESVSELSSYAYEHGVTPFFSVFSLKDAKRLISHGAAIVKIPSHEAYNLELVKYCLDNFECVIGSCGAISEAELNAFVNLFQQAKGANNWLLHCVSGYPLAPDQVNFPKLLWLKERFENIGFSDHTNDVLTPSIAVGLGAQMIEKHFTTDHNLPGRDNKFALDPGQFSEMVSNCDHALKTTLSSGLGIAECERDIVINYRGRWSGDA